MSRIWLAKRKRKCLVCGSSVKKYETLYNSNWRVNKHWFKCEHCGFLQSFLNPRMLSYLESGAGGAGGVYEWAFREYYISRLLIDKLKLNRILIHGAGWTDAFEYSLGCYLHAKEKGYKDKDINIVFPRFGYEKYIDIEDKEVNQQPTKFFPWKYLPNNIYPSNEYDEIVDTTKKNSLYEGYPGIGKHCWFMHLFFEVYYKKYNKEPYFNIERDNIDNPYILVHYRGDRIGAFHKERETPLNELKYILKIIRENTNLDIWKIGESCSIDDKFDKLIPYMYGDLDSFSRLVRNSSLLIGSHAGPPAVGNFFKDLPLIRFGMLPQYSPINTNAFTRYTNGLNRKYNIPYHPYWYKDNLIYRDINQVTNEKIKTIYSDINNPPLEKDIIKMIKDWNL